MCPDSAEAHCNLGINYKDLGNSQEAIESFKAAIRIRPDYTKAVWNLGIAYVELGDLENALKEYETLQKLDNKTHSDELYSAINANSAS